MAIDMKQYELDRVVNMLKAFGWSVVSTAFSGNKITATFEKLVVAEVPK